MVRGVVPRQPAKTGRHEGGGVSRPLKTSQKNAGLRPVRSGQRPGLTQSTKKRSRAQSAKAYDPLAPERVTEILKRLDQLYPDVTCALTHKSAWELLVATILSAQSTDVNVNRVTPELFRKYPTVADFAALTPEQLEPDVRSTGFFRNKSKSVVGAAKKIVSDFGGQVPDDMETLLTLPGVARVIFPVKAAELRKSAAQGAGRGSSERGTQAAPKRRKKASDLPKAVPIKGRAYNPLAPERIAEILNRLDQLYPDVTSALTHRSAWELLVATILSAQSTDVNVNRVTPELFRKYPTVEAFAALSPEQLEPDIRSTGFFRNKSKSVVGAARKVVSDFGGQVPMNMPDLLTLPGVARKTANVVLGSWFKIAEGVVVDTHVHRISRRLELTTNNDPQRIEQDLMREIPREKWILFAHQIIWHGRKLCLARKPKCVDCLLENICHAADKTWSTVEMHKNAKA